MRRYAVHVDAFIIGSLRASDPVNEPILKALRISQQYAVLMRPLMVSETIAFSRDIYVDYVRQRSQRNGDDASPDAAAYP